MSNTAATTTTTTGAAATFVDRIDPFTKISVLKRKTKRSQGSSSSSRYRTCSDVELQPLPLLKGEYKINFEIFEWLVFTFIFVKFFNCKK